MECFNKNRRWDVDEVKESHRESKNMSLKSASFRSLSLCGSALLFSALAVCCVLFFFLCVSCVCVISCVLVLRGVFSIKIPLFKNSKITEFHDFGATFFLDRIFSFFFIFEVRAMHRPLKTEFLSRCLKNGQVFLPVSCSFSMGTD